jgi:hypothetical protein
MFIQFNQRRCRIQWSRHQASGRPAILLVEAQAPGSVLAVATVDRADLARGADQVAIADFGPAAGALAALIEAGVISPPLRVIDADAARIAICRLLVDAVNSAD